MWAGLNCRPLPCQGSALPLSYTPVRSQTFNGFAWGCQDRGALRGAFRNNWADLPSSLTPPGHCDFVGPATMHVLRLVTTQREQCGDHDEHTARPLPVLTAAIGTAHRVEVEVACVPRVGSGIGRRLSVATLGCVREGPASTIGAVSGSGPASGGTQTPPSLGARGVGVSTPQSSMTTWVACVRESENPSAGVPALVVSLPPKRSTTGLVTLPQRTQS